MDTPLRSIRFFDDVDGLQIDLGYSCDRVWCILQSSRKFCVGEGRCALSCNTNFGTIHMWLRGVPSSGLHQDAHENFPSTTKGYSRTKLVSGLRWTPHSARYAFSMMLALQCKWISTRRSAPTRTWSTEPTKSKAPACQRDAGWDVEREGRETKVEPPTRPVKLCTGDFGTSVRHPPSERIDTAYVDRHQYQRADTPALPYTDISND
jgi:hypothetical protein